MFGGWRIIICSLLIINDEGFGHVTTTRVYDVVILHITDMKSQ